MNSTEIVFTKGDLLQALAENIPAIAGHQICDEYFGLFGQRSNELTQEGQVALSAAHHLLGAASTLRLEPANPHQPFVPLHVINDSRSSILDDFTDKQLRIVGEIVAEVSDAELRARLADLVWLRCRDYKAAKLAVPSYLESAKQLFGTLRSSWAVQRLSRALQVAAMLGTSQLLFEKTVEAIENIAFESGQPALIVAGCIELLLPHSKRASELADLAKSRAECDEASDKPIWQRRFWTLTANWSARAERHDDVRAARIAIAKTFEFEAAEALKRETPSYLVASSFLEQAIQAYRRVPDTETERDRLHKTLLRYQAKARNELVTDPSPPVDLSDVATEASDSIKGKCITDALEHLALSGSVRRKSELRAEAEEDSKTFMLQFMFPNTTLSQTGKVVSKRGGMSSDSESDNESVIIRQMHWHASIYRDLLVTGQIEPMRRQVLADHYVRYHDFLPFVEYNPLVPEGRERFFILALHAGLHDNFVESLHILIPQLENSLRTLLSFHGVITSTLDQDGLQKERDLNDLLYEPKLEELIHEDIVFDLRGLLVERAGSNFRNQQAHGMLELGSYFTNTAVYIWWLIFRMICLARRPRP